MLHVHIAQLVAPGAQPPGHRSERFRKRKRKLRPVRPSHADERSYLLDLRAFARGLKTLARTDLVPKLRAQFPGSFATDAEVPPRLQQIVGDVAKTFGGINRQAERMAALAAQRSLGSVDERLARSIRDSVSVNIEPYLTRDGRIGKVLGEKVLDNVALIKSVPEQYFQDIAERVAGNWREGGRWEGLAAQLEESGEVMDSRIEVIARDQTSKMNAAFNQVRQTDVGIEEYEWAATHDERTRSWHWDLNGTVHRWDEPGPCEGTIDGEPCHPGEDVECLPGDSQIQFADGVEKAYRRWYSGELSELITSSGEVLRCTPNHPVLTPAGWCPAGLLDEGDYVVQASEEVSRSSEENGKHRVTTIGEVFELASERGFVESTRGGARQFHGDGAAGQVDVVLPLRSLRIDRFTGCAERGDPSASICGEAACSELPRNQVDVVPYGVRCFLQGLPFGHQFSRVVKHRRLQWSGHVFNLQTSTGWYHSGIVLRNCRCDAIPYVDLDALEQSLGLAPMREEAA